MKNISEIFTKLGIKQQVIQGSLSVSSPIDGKVIGNLPEDDIESFKGKIDQAQKAFRIWQDVPAPKRGELIRVFAQKLREYKEPLAQLVSLECGKIIEEGRGEVQEMIDICDFAVGLSRSIGGLTLPSERENHVMHENWLPLGVVGVISAFNFPVAVWAWNFALSTICGNSTIWKPSEKTPFCALACQNIIEEAIEDCDVKAPENLSQIIIGRAEIGEALVQSNKVALVSATGSTAMGKKVGHQVAARFGKCLLELGGNNAVIVTPSADLNVTLPSILFGAVGTAGQRCTTTRRAFIHKLMYEDISARLKQAYSSLENKIGNPLDTSNLIGPLIDQSSFEKMQQALEQATKQGGKVFGGQRIILDEYPDAYYVQPAFVQMTQQTSIVQNETFAPILYLIPYDTLDHAMEMHNDVTQGLSSAIFTTDIREAEFFKKYSDCGIANVNIGTSGAEIGGAFGGEKETGGGRESGSDAWKTYMRRQTSTTYYGKSVPSLAQGIDFKL